MLALWPKNAEIHLVFMTSFSERLSNLNHLVKQGKLKVIVDKFFPLEMVAEAHEYMEEKGRVGKVVIKID